MRRFAVVGHRAMSKGKLPSMTWPAQQVNGRAIERLWPGS